MRDSGFVSTGPNFAKSTSGHAGRLKGRVPPVLASAGAPPFDRAPFTNACTSACTIRPFGPLPCTRPRSTPSSRANLRTDGLACALEMVSSRGSRGTGRVGDGAGAAAGLAAGAAADAVAGRDFATSFESSTRTGEPLDTLSPTFTFKSFTTPAAGDGISIVALSDSSVMSDCSFVTASPGLTRTSITSTSLKSPMSGTGTVIAPPPGLAGSALAGSADLAGSALASLGFSSGGASPLPLSSSTRIGEPFETLSPTLILSSLTTPEPGEGISIVALSDSSVISDCSFATASPGFTSTSMTSTSLKSPMSGTTTWLMSGSYLGRISLLGIDAVFLDRIGHRLRLPLALVGERLQRRDGDEVAVHLEEVAQLRARVRASEAVGAQSAVDAVLGNERTDQLGEGLQVVRRRHHGTRRPLLQTLDDVRHAWFRLWVQHVPAIGGEPVAAKLGEARRAPHIGGHAPVFLEQPGRSLDLAQDRAASQ